MPAVLWLALALVGQIASLRLIDAGPLIHYQHYVLPPAALRDPARAWAEIAVALQTAMVGAGLLLKARKAGLQNRSGAHALAAWPAPPRIAGALALWLCFAAALSRDPRFFGLEFIFAALIQLVNAGNIVLFAWALPGKALEAIGRVARLLLGGEWKAAVRIDRFAWLAAAWVTLVSAALAIGEKLHAAWLVNPVWGGVNVLLIYLLLGALYPRRIARIAVLLLCISPWYLFLAMSYMNHIVTLTCALAAFGGIIKARATGLAWWAFAAGLAVGIASTIRPLDGAIMALLGAAWALGLGGSRLRLASLAALAAGTALAGALALPYNKALNGGYASPLTYYTNKTYGPKAAAYGFGPERGLGWAIDPYPGHTPFEAVILGELNGHSLNTELFGWSAGSLFLMAILLSFGAPRRGDYLMLAAIAATILAYAPYWTNGGPDFGARYWFLALVPCLALSARGLGWLEARVAARATAAVAALCAMTLVIYIPWRAVDKYHHYLRMRADVRDLAVRRGFGRSLVLVRGDRFPDYASAAIYNPLDLQADAPIYVWDRSAEVRAKIMSLYPDRPVWVLEGPTITGAGYRVAEGPLRAGATP